MITVRPARPEDGHRTVAIWEAAVDATHHFLSARDRAEIGREVAAFLPSAPLWLAVDEADVALGFLLLDGEKMEALFIHPEHRGRGIGRRLVEHAWSLHPVLDVDVNEQNLQAVGFYERLGFARVGRSDTDGQGRAYPLLHMCSAARSAVGNEIAGAG